MAAHSTATPRLLPACTLAAAGVGGDNPPGRRLSGGPVMRGSDVSMCRVSPSVTRPEKREPLVLQGPSRLSSPSRQAAGCPTSGIARWTAVACRLVACLGMAIVAVSASAADRAAPPTNVVLIVSDDQHWRDYGFMGHEHLRTPCLDRLARESLVYPRGYVTSSLCCPSLAALITGRYPHETGIVGNDPPGTDGPRTTPAAKAAFAAGREAMNRKLDAFPTLPKLLGPTLENLFQAV